MPGIVADECWSAVHAARLIAPQASGGPPSRLDNRGRRHLYYQAEKALALLSSSAHRLGPLFELQDLGSVRTNSTVADFSFTSILLPSGLSDLDGRVLAL